MKNKETFTERSIIDIDNFVAKVREELRSLRFSLAGSKTRNVKHSRNLRRSIAQALTARTFKVKETTGSSVK